MSDPDNIIEDELVAEDVPTQKEMMRSIMIQSAAVAKAKAAAAEKKIKGFYCDYVFGRLNLMKYR